MQRQDIVKILSILKTAYPRFYQNMSKEDANETINLWQEMLSDCEPTAVIIGVKNLINTLQFPPTIADIKNEVFKLRNEQKLPIELWNELKCACRNGLYYANEIFPELSMEVQKFLKNPMQLKELAMMDVSTLDTVIRGQFLKQVEIIQEREKELSLMLPERRELLSKLSQKMNIDNLLGA